LTTSTSLSTAVSKSQRDTANDDIMVLRDWLKTPDGSTCCVLVGTIKIVPEIRCFGMRKETPTFAPCSTRELRPYGRTASTSKINDDLRQLIGSVHGTGSGGHSSAGEPAQDRQSA
jgi:hypothetical protein